MRLTSFGIVLVLMTGFLAGRTNAQIPERVLFQPGSYAYGMYQHGGTSPQGMVPTKTILVEVPDDKVESARENGDEKTEWEKNFDLPETQGRSTKLVEMQVPDPNVTATQESRPPYLAYHRHPITHRIHLIPYQKGYEAAPEQFPEHQSNFNLWLSSLPCREQNRPQIQYLGYYDPMPEVIEDRPSRLQLILGYPNANWTTCCDNRWGYRMAQCPGVEYFANGPPAEGAIADQMYDTDLPQGPFGGVLSGPSPIEYGPMGPPARRGLFGGRRAPMPYPNPYCVQPAPMNPVPQSLPCPPNGSSCCEQAPCNHAACSSCSQAIARKRVACPPPKNRYPLKAKSMEMQE